MLRLSKLRNVCRAKPVLVSNTLQRNYAVDSKIPSTVGVVLTGAGHLDGSEITEAVSVLVQLSKAKKDYIIIVPEKNQEVTYDHMTETPEANEIRNIQSEVMRITRTSKVATVSNVSPDKVGSLLFVGGFGVARTLSDYATEGSDMNVDPEIEALIKSFHKEQRTLGFMCIAPVLAAKVLGTANGGPGVRVATGTDADTKLNIEAMGNEGVAGGVNSIIRDENNSIISTPAFLASDAAFDTVFDATERFVTAFSRGFDARVSESEDEWGRLNEFFVREWGADQFGAFKKALSSVDEEKKKTEAERKIREDANQERQAKMDRMREAIAELQQNKEK